MSDKMVVNGKEVDIQSVLPLKLRDWKEIKTRFKFDITSSNMDLDSIIGIVTYVFQKANKDITDDDVMDLDLGALNKVAGAASSQGEVDRPT